MEVHRTSLAIGICNLGAKDVAENNFPNWSSNRCLVRDNERR